MARFSRRTVVGLLASFAAASAMAQQEYPNRPIG